MPFSTVSIEERPWYCLRPNTQPLSCSADFGTHGNTCFEGYLWGRLWVIVFGRMY
jgi:hypothetical protein